VCGAGLWLFAATAFAHAQGVHVKLGLTVGRTHAVGLLVMDVDAGSRCEVLRLAADANHDGKLTGEERQALKARLQGLALQGLVVSVAGLKLPVTVQEAKLSLREDDRANDSGLSLAVLFEVRPPRPVEEGAPLEVQARSPDVSAVPVTVAQVTEREVPDTSKALEPGESLQVRLGRLVDRE
jgi:hypothetical protein